MLQSIKNYFKFDDNKTDFRTEILSGITTFVTMAYIIIVNPAILEVAGIARDASVTATILISAFGTFLMAVYAKRPFAVAPLMGENAFISFTVVKVMGYSWQIALGAVFLSGILFALLTILNIRGYLAKSIPLSLKNSFAVGIGLFLAFIGLNETGIVTLGGVGAPVRPGNFADPHVLLSILGFFLIVFLMIKKIRSAIITGILIISGLSILLGYTPFPENYISFPASIKPIVFQLDVIGALKLPMLPVILTVFIMVFVDTLGTLFGLSVKAGLLDSEGNLSEIEKPMLTDAVATSLAAVIGTSTTGAYIESAAGIEAGGRTGFSSIITSILFLFSLFITPLFCLVPQCAYGPSLIVVGLLMLEPIKKIQFEDYTELVPAFLTIVLMIFTFNIGVGMTAGFIAFTVLKILSGRIKEISLGMWVLSCLSLLFFIVSPK